MRDLEDDVQAKIDRTFVFLVLTLLVGAITFLTVKVIDEPESLSMLRTATRALWARDPAGPELAAELHRRFPDDVNAIFLAGEAAAQIFEHQQAIELFRRLPRDQGAWEVAADLGLAKRYRVLGMQVEEEWALRNILKLDPTHSEANHRLGHLMQVQGRTWDSVAPFMNQIRRGKCRGDELMGVASTERFFRFDDDAEFAVAKNTQRQAVTHLGTARRHLFENRNAEAELLLRQIVAGSPHLGEAQGRLGRILVENGRLAEFIQWRGRLPEAARQHPEVWFVQGVQARRLGMIEGAAYCFVRTLLLSPSHLPANTQISACFAHLGRFEEAEYFRERTVALSELESSLNILRFNIEESLIEKTAAQLARLERYWEAAGWMYVRSSLGPIPEPLVASTREWTALAKSDPDQHFGFAERMQSLQLQDLVEPNWSTVSPDLPQTDPLPHKSPAMSETRLSLEDEAQSLGVKFDYFEGTTESDRLRHIFNVVGGGVGVIDLDLDLWPDLYLAQANDWRNPESQAQHLDGLFRNLRGSRFQDVATVAGLMEPEFSHGVTVDDYNQDGLPDIYVSNLGSNRLFHNLGDGTFEDVSEPSGTGGAEWSIHSAFADINGDGLPDLYVGNYTHLDETAKRICHRPDGREMACTPDVLTAQSDRLYLNLGDGQFRDVTQESQILEDSGRALGLVGWDFFAEDQINLFVANDTSANFLFRQTDAATSDTDLKVPVFRDEGLVQGVAFDADGNAQASMGVASGDVNQDGYIDLFITNFSNESNTLYVQSPQHSFLDQSRQFRLRDPGFNMLGFGTQFVDVNFDGWPDLVLTNGHVDQSESQPNADRMRPQLFLNQQGQYFDEVPGEASGSFFSQRSLGRGLATLDWNRDGKTDFVVTHIHAPVSLVTNRTQLPQKATTVRLLGRARTRNAIGARIRIRVAGQERHHQLVAGHGYLVTNELSFPVYAGEASPIEQIDVVWPGGRTQTWTQLPDADEIVLIEGRDIAEETTR
jgi:tetratricopeptide (TPR) repeat protein